MIDYASIVERRYRRISVFSPGPTGPTPAESDRVAIDIFCWGYMPKQGDVVLDIGAGTGTETLTFARLVGEEGRVVAVEAHPVTAECLTRTVRANSINNVSIETSALVEFTGPITLSDDPQAWVGNSVVSSSQVNSVSVDGIRLDELIARHGLTRVPIALLKLNIEGAEAGALRGADDALGYVHNVAVSCHDFKADRTGDEAFRTKAIVIRALERLGFATRVRDDDRPYVADMVYASRP